MRPLAKILVFFLLAGLTTSPDLRADQDRPAETSRNQHGSWRKKASKLRFEDLSEEEKTALRERYRKHMERSPEERKRIEQQAELWKNLSADQQESLRHLYRNLKNASPEQKQAIREQMKKFQQLGPEEQKQFLQKVTERRLRAESQKGDFMNAAGRPMSDELKQKMESHYAGWNDFSPEQQRMLAFLDQRLDKAPAERKQKLIERMEKFRQLPSEQQKRLLNQMLEKRHHFRERGRPGRDSDSPSDAPARPEHRRPQRPHSPRFSARFRSFRVVTVSSPGPWRAAGRPFTKRAQFSF